MGDLDHGHGDPRKFPVEDLERQYRLEAREETRIKGDQLNKILHVNSYNPTAWYVVADGKVQKT